MVNIDRKPPTLERGDETIKRFEKELNENVDPLSDFELTLFLDSRIWENDEAIAQGFAESMGLKKEDPETVAALEAAKKDAEDHKQRETPGLLKAIRRLPFAKGLFEAAKSLEHVD